MTKEEARKYAAQIFKESGVSDEEATQYLKLFENDKFVHGFVPRPEVDRSLDAERQKYKTHAERNKYLEEEWLPQAKQAYEKNVKGIKMLEKYQELYGAIDESDPAAVSRAAKATGVSKEELADMLQRELATRDRATLDLMEIREDYMDRFKKRLPLKDFEKHVADMQKSGEYAGLRAAYKDWIEPQVDQATPHRFSEEELKARDKRIREDAEKDFASRHKIPVDQRPREAHILFDNAKLRAEKEKANGEAKSGMDAFLEVLNDPQPETVRQRYPV